MPATPAADIEAEFLFDRLQPAFQRANDTGGDSRRVPVHPHDRAERLEPERMRQPAQQLLATIFVDDSLADHGAELGHALAEPGRNPSAMQRQVGAAGSLGHLVSSLCRSGTYRERVAM
jgi:hypothetical protein